MATGFSTKSGPDGYRLNFDTDNLDYYLLMQKIARHCVDGKPAADVALVVRCRDCKWFNHYTMECESDDVATDHEGGASFSINFGPDDFCSYGQRKEADHVRDN